MKSTTLSARYAQTRNLILAWAFLITQTRRRTVIATHKAITSSRISGPTKVAISPPREQPMGLSREAVILRTIARSVNEFNLGAERPHDAIRHSAWSRELAIQQAQDTKKRLIEMHETRMRDQWTVDDSNPPAKIDG